MQRTVLSSHPHNRNLASTLGISVLQRNLSGELKNENERRSQFVNVLVTRTDIAGLVTYVLKRACRA